MLISVSDNKSDMILGHDPGILMPTYPWHSDLDINDDATSAYHATDECQHDVCVSQLVMIDTTKYWIQ